MSKYKVIVIGGSAGSFQIVTKILSQIDPNINIPIVLCLHRLKHIKNGFVESLNIKSKIKIVEPEDKDSIKAGKGYLAPSNYHMLAEIGNTFALSTDEMVKYSRPSIDLAFDSFSYIYREKMIGIILTGANTDGCDGIFKAHKRGAYTIVQDLSEATMPTMPEGALKLFKPNQVLNSDKIVEFLNKLQNV